MAKTLPYYPMYVNDFDEDPHVLAMNLAEVGLYVFCLNESWKRGFIPAELDKLATMIRRPLSEVKKAWPGIASRWVPLGGDAVRLVNPRQEEERSKAETISGVRSYASKLSHRKKTAFAGANDGSLAGSNATYDSVSKCSSKILSRNDDELSQQVKWSIFQTRIKKAGVKFNFRYSEKKQAQDWLAACDEPFDDILAAVQVFAEDEYWNREGHPWNAWPKQFEQFLEAARERGAFDAQRDESEAEDVPQPESAADAPQLAVVPKRDFLEEWNVQVSDAFTERERRRHPNSFEPEFIAEFDKICEVARGIRKNKPDSTWLTFYWLLDTKIGHSRPNWKRLITDMRGMAMGRAYPESGQTDDKDAPWRHGGKFRNQAEIAQFIAEKQAEAELEEAG